MKPANDMLVVAHALARRSLDVAADSATSLADGADHLARLAKQRRVPLRLALAQLRQGGSTSATCAQADAMLQLAITQVGRTAIPFETRRSA